MDDVPANPNSWGYIVLGDYQQRGFHLWKNLLFSFAAFVLFVVIGRIPK